MVNSYTPLDFATARTRPGRAADLDDTPSIGLSRATLRRRRQPSRSGPAVIGHASDLDQRHVLEAATTPYRAPVNGVGSLFAQNLRTAWLRVSLHGNERLAQLKSAYFATQEAAAHAVLAAILAFKFPIRRLGPDERREPRLSLRRPAIFVGPRLPARARLGILARRRPRAPTTPRSGVRTSKAAARRTRR